ncbi:DUF6933 domain-containing protein [Paenibacillus puerhi]|uniref:DUF6933 domain-containing protein n=1 Tax=Paenibacillus puerhi TaxID=2692622 RepID=UPI001356A556|nr:hypothetical protein [Paenibacillus puerhi]
MLIFRVTKSLLKELKLQSTRVDIADPFFSWHANNFVLNRRKCIVFMNDLTRLSVTLYGIKAKEYKDLDGIFKVQLRDYLISENIEEERIDKYLERCGDEAIISDTNNRSVLGTLKEVMLIMNTIEKNEWASNLERDQWNNTIIYKPIGYQQPIDVFKNEINKL